VIRTIYGCVDAPEVPLGGPEHIPSGADAPAVRPRPAASRLRSTPQGLTLTVAPGLTVAQGRRRRMAVEARSVKDGRKLRSA
jgi:hypothetical protein